MLILLLGYDPFLFDIGIEMLIDDITMYILTEYVNHKLQNK